MAQRRRLGGYALRDGYAELGGCPVGKPVIETVNLLAKLEAEDRASPKGFEDLPLFAGAGPRRTAMAQESALGRLLASLAALNPDEMSPREAMDALYALKAEANPERKI